ncbi:MAG: diphthamide biosynthesis enzyme Dph2 [Methanobacteriota archaeon]
MKVGDLDVDIGCAVKEALKRKAKSIVLQVPEGLKRRAGEMADAFERKGISVILAGDPCYGACDLCAGHGRDILVHVGHTPLGLPGDDEVIFVEAISSAPVEAVVCKALPLLGSKAGLVTTAQHAHMLDAATALVRKSGRKALRGTGDGRVKYPGQVLGCNASAARSVAKRVDSFLFIGTGVFHPIAVSLATRKPTIAADPLSGEVQDVGPLAERILRRRHGLIAVASKAHEFGIIVCTKRGQRRKSTALALARKIKKSGRSARIVAANEIEPWRFKGFGFDALVSTACPRLAIDDCARFDVPLLTPVEAEIAIGGKAWGDYQFDEIAPSLG